MAAHSSMELSGQPASLCIVTETGVSVPMCFFQVSNDKPTIARLRDLAERAEERSDISNEEIGYFHGREMASLIVL